MVDELNRVWVDQQSKSEVQRHANMVEAAKRAQEHQQHQPSSKPPSEIWDKVYPIARVVFPTMAVVGVLATLGFAVWIVLTSG